MKLKYLGTAAYEGIPAIGCQCETCKKSRELGGKNIRLRTQTLVNDDLMIDYPEDAIHYSIKYNIDYNKIKNVLITHAHIDHLCARDIEAFRVDFCTSDRTEPIHFFADKKAYDEISAITCHDYMKGRVDVTLISPNQTFMAGDYKITAIRANHDENSSPLVYVIEKDNKRFLYLHDSGFLSEESWKQLEKCGRLNLVSFDCTCGALNNIRDGHMSFDVVLETEKKMREIKVLDEYTVKILNHFSHNGHLTHEDYIKMAEKYLKYITAYDGMEVEF
ncbi:MAG: MBL fold metallo-hydrolase [Clostridia bacterium]|nr:MBL fold metallo-hydrolase [Clostridia bacterium]